MASSKDAAERKWLSGGRLSGDGLSGIGDLFVFAQSTLLPVRHRLQQNMFALSDKQNRVNHSTQLGASGRGPSTPFI